MTWADVMVLMIINELVTSFIYLSIYVFVTTIKVLILLWFNTWWVCVCVLVTQSCLTLSDPMDCGPPASSVHGILQARILEWIAIPFSRGSSRPRAHTQASRIAGRFLTIWATRGAPESLLMSSMLRATSGSPLMGVPLLAYSLGQILQLLAEPLT